MATSNPTIDDYLNAASQASFDGATGPGVQPLTDANSQSVMETINSDGFSAEAFVTTDKQLIVAYAGTDFKQLRSKPEFLAAQLADDYLIYLGYNPPAFADGVSFLQQAETAAVNAGVSIAAGNVFVDGHSLGGAIAAYVAAQDDLPGTTFAAPGLAPGDIPSGADAGDVTAYVEYGDPIGNYGNNPNYEGAFLYNQGITRFGTTTYIGHKYERAELIAAAYVYSQDKDEGFAAFAADALLNHALSNYEADLSGASQPSATTGPEVTAQQLITAVQQVIATVKAASVSVSLDPTVSFTDPTTAMLTGQATSPAGVQSVEITAQVDGVNTDLGAATVNADGAFTFTDVIGSHVQSEITATATDTAGKSASQTSSFTLQGTLKGGSYGATADPQTTDGGSTTTSPLFLRGGSNTIDIRAPGQIVASNKYDVFANGHQKNTTFVFSPGFGIDVVKGFTAAGPGSDVLALPLADFQNLASVLRNTGDVNGSAFITDPKTGDAIRVAGVTTAELKAHPKDFVLV